MYNPAAQFIIIIIIPSEMAYNITEKMLSPDVPVKFNTDNFTGMRREMITTFH